MATTIGDYVLSGELRNSRRNGVFGWLEFAPDYGIRLELTGNFADSLGGLNFRFHVPSNERKVPIQPGEFPDAVEALADRQIGVVGEISLRPCLVPTVSPEVFAAMDEEAQKKNSCEKPCLVLEWFSQNGRVMVQLTDPTIEYRAEETLNEGEEEDGQDDGFGAGFTEVRLDEDTRSADDFLIDSEEAETEEDDPYGLFDASLQEKVSESLGTLPDDEFEENSDSGENKRSWEEVIPGIDPATKEMYEQWDEIFEGKKDEPLSYLFETPLKLPKPSAVASDEEAWPLVTAILAQLALLSVALDVCEHFRPLQIYKLLMTEIIPNAKVHPNLAASEMVQHYSTSDYCDDCEADFERENAAADSPTDGDSDSTPSDSQDSQSDQDDTDTDQASPEG